MSLLASPQLVGQSSNAVPQWLEYIGAFSGLAGALLAAIAILYASRQSVKAKKDLVRERRVVFELGLLAEIRHQMSITQFQHLSGYIAALILRPGDERELAVLRAATGTKAGPVGREQIKRLSQQAAQSSGDRQSILLEEAAKEIDEAIERRMEGE